MLGESIVHVPPMTPSPTLALLPFAPPPAAPSWPHAPPKGAKTRQWLPLPQKSITPWELWKVGKRNQDFKPWPFPEDPYIYLHLPNVGKYTIHGSSGIESGTHLEKRTVTNSSPIKRGLPYFNRKGSSEPSINGRCTCY